MDLDAEFLLEVVWEVVEPADFVGWNSLVQHFRVREVQIGHDLLETLNALCEARVQTLLLSNRGTCHSYGQNICFRTRGM